MTIYFIADPHAREVIEAYKVAWIFKLVGREITSAAVLACADRDENGEHYETTIVIAHWVAGRPDLCAGSDSADGLPWEERDTDWRRLDVFNDRDCELILRTPPPALATIAVRVRAWRLQQFGEQSAMRNLAQITEEVGEVARAVGKAEEGIREDTRGNVDEELGDVILATCGMAAALGIDLDAVVAKRLARMEALDFRK